LGNQPAGTARVLAVNYRTVPERYVSLCLRVGAHIEDFVDAYFGPAALQEEALADRTTRTVFETRPSLCATTPPGRVWKTTAFDGSSAS
jgi:hypothetical protein